jgi:hypothetical protein
MRGLGTLTPGIGNDMIILASEPYLMRFVQEGIVTKISPFFLLSSTLSLYFFSRSLRISRLNQTLDSTFAMVITPMRIGKANSGSGCAREEIDKKDSASRGVGSLESCIKREERVRKTGIWGPMATNRVKTGPQWCLLFSS